MNIDQQGFVPSLPDVTGMGSVMKQTEVHYMWRVCKKSQLEMLLPRLIKHQYIKAQHWQWMLDTWRDIRSRPYGEKWISTQEKDALAQASIESRKHRVGPIKPKNYPSWAWVSGYLDGDGYYSHRNPKKKRYGMRVGACAHVTDISVLEFLQKTFGGKITQHSQSKYVFEWERSLSNANRSFALRFLPKVAKHSRLKRHKIDLMIHHHLQRLSVSGPAG